MKILFAGTPEFAVFPFERIRETGTEIAAVVTQPDKPIGRKAVMTPPPVKKAALACGVPVFQPDKIGNETEALRAFGADAMVTCAYGQLLTQAVLDLFPLGVWNIHASLLPAYRGAAPIARALIDGCTETGVTIMKTELGLDTGDILLSERCPIFDSDDRAALEGRLSRLSGDLIAAALKTIAQGDPPLKKQGEGFTCKKVRRMQADFSAPAREVSCLIRGLSPAPLAFGRVGELELNFFFAETVAAEESAPFGTVLCASPKEGLVVKCGSDAVRITELQPSGGKRMNARDFLNGRKLKEGQRFDQPVL